MKQKWIYPTLVLFFLFYVLSSPGSAGPQVRTFFDWIGDQAANVGTFLDGLFDDNPDVGGTDTGTESSTSTESGVGPTGGGQPPPATDDASNEASDDSFDTLGPWSTTPLRL